MTLRSISVHYPTEHQDTHQGFSVNRVLDDEARPFMDPYLMVDAYTLTEPYFAPHPHAGFAPVTYMFPESEIGFINRDSMGLRNRVAPGSMHWMTAGRGIVHEEVPEIKGRAARGLQIFVNLPTKLKFMDPGYVHVEAQDVPVVEAKGAIIRAALGASNGVASPGITPYPVRLIDVTLAPGGVFEQALEPDENCFLYAFEGDCLIETPQGRAKLDAFDVIGTARGGTILRAVGGEKRARFALFAGIPIGEPVMSYGPFIMSRREDLMKVMDDYRLGRMGKVEKAVFGPDGRPQE
jgi:redox-sensitive bicupin YhaK (pirin superfamily)